MLVFTLLALFSRAAAAEGALRSISDVSHAVTPPCRAPAYRMSRNGFHVRTSTMAPCRSLTGLLSQQLWPMGTKGGAAGVIQLISQVLPEARMGISQQLAPGHLPHEAMFYSWARKASACARYAARASRLLVRKRRSACVAGMGGSRPLISTPADDIMRRGLD